MLWTNDVNTPNMYAMTHSGENNTWLETASGKRFEIRGTCSVGRSKSNQVVLPDSRVSRLHALVQLQNGNEYWLVDFGSTNGTYLNGRRVTQPTALRDGDRIEIADACLVFHDASDSKEFSSTAPSDITFEEVKSVPCWLLVADIVSYTHLSQSLSPEKLPVMTGRWLSQCKQLVEDNAGSINKFLGDGFLAYWRDGAGVTAKVAGALAALERLQAEGEPRFRVVVHHGEVSVGGGGALVEESLLGQELNFVFRVEKLASLLELPVMFSEAASRKLQPHVATVPLGQHEVKGFDGQFVFFAPKPGG
jgi:adenylate cyclase